MLSEVFARFPKTATPQAGLRAPSDIITHVYGTSLTASDRLVRMGPEREDRGTAAVGQHILVAPFFTVCNVALHTAVVSTKKHKHTPNSSTAVRHVAYVHGRHFTRTDQLDRERHSAHQSAQLHNLCGTAEPIRFRIHNS